jgi:flagellar basal body-associated protein FliL
MILFVPKLNIRATIVFFFSFHCNSHCDYSNQKKKKERKRWLYNISDLIFIIIIKVYIVFNCAGFVETFRVSSVTEIIFLSFFYSFFLFSSFFNEKLENMFIC